MRGKKILVIDDDLSLCRMLDLTLSQEGAIVSTANDGRNGLQQFYKIRPDLVLLDVMMPDMDGWQTCQQIRALSHTPIIMLTAVHDDESIIKGLDYGADDYIPKPFTAQVLHARVRSVLRRASLPSAATEAPSTVYRDDHLAIELEQRRVLVDGEPVRLTPTEFRLLAYLLQQAGRVLTYDRILENVWGWEYRDNVDYVHVYLSHLRRKIEQDPRNPRYLLTEHGVGYRFKGPDDD